MDDYELKILTILHSTNKTLYDAQMSNQYRLNAMPQLNDNIRSNLEAASIAPLELPLQKIRNEIYNYLILSVEYLDCLSHIPYINIYDATEIIVEIGNINRFPNRKKFLAYAGLAPVEKRSNKVYKITKNSKKQHVANKKYDNIDYCENLKVALTRCTQKMINNDEKYNNYYQNSFRYYQFQHPRYHKHRLHLMALKKTTIKFAKMIYKDFKYIKKIEEYEREVYADENK